MKKLFIIGIAALLLVAFTVPAMAKVKVGGIIYTDLFYIDRDAKNAAARGYGNDPYQVTAIGLPNFSRLYARWTNEDNVGMFIEFGIGQPTNGTDLSKSDGVVLRHAYGWWDVNPNFQILAGKSTTPFSPLVPSQMVGYTAGNVNVIGLGYGEWYSGRFAQVRGTFKFGKMGRVSLTLVDPNGSQRTYGGSPWDTTATNLNNFFPVELAGAQLGQDYQNNSKIPAFHLTSALYFGPIAIYPGFLYQYRTVDYLDPTYSMYDDSLSTWAGTLGVKGGFGPFGFKVEGNYGNNVGNTRMGLGNSAPCSLASALPNVDGKINDATTWGYWLDVYYKLGPVTPHFIWGQLHSDVDFQYQKWDATSSMIGVSVPISLAKGFTIRPEFMWYDDGEFEVGGNDIYDMGKYAIYGVQFQITF
jgi:hypothetical protein